jgi:hypothetical protein
MEIPAYSRGITEGKRTIEVLHNAAPMADLLACRNGTWHFTRRVPAQFARVDKRIVIRHSNAHSNRAGLRGKTRGGAFRQ